MKRNPLGLNKFKLLRPQKIILALYITYGVVALYGSPDKFFVSDLSWLKICLQLSFPFTTFAAALWLDIGKTLEERKNDLGRFAMIVGGIILGLPTIALVVMFVASLLDLVSAAFGIIGVVDPMQQLSLLLILLLLLILASIVLVSTEK